MQLPLGEDDFKVTNIDINVVSYFITHCSGYYLLSSFW